VDHQRRQIWISQRRYTVGSAPTDRRRRPRYKQRRVPSEKARSRIKLAISTTEVFKALYERYNGQKLLSTALLEDTAVELGVPYNFKIECIEIFIINLRFVGLLQTLSGAERILTTHHALDQIPAVESSAVSSLHRTEQPLVVHSDAQFDRLCFFIGPIGDAASEYGKHSDLILESLIRPAMQLFALEVRRADEIQNPGLITKQIFEYLLKSRLAIADLSYHNPNVFYELAIRYAKHLPVIQIIRKADRIPFDVNQSRSIVIDTTDLYSFVPKIEIYKTEISNHIRRALEDPASADNPLSEGRARESFAPVTLSVAAQGLALGWCAAVRSAVTEMRRPSARMTLVRVSRVGLPLLESER
jgi:hypothetical protein